MAEYLSPGVFIEEVNTSGQQVEAVGTSTMAIVGWTERGASDTATIVTSSDDFFRKFGEYTNDSRVPISIQAFFGNGGTRAYVVRVVPTDAVAGDSLIANAVTGEVIEEADGSDPFTANGTLAEASAETPITPGSVVVSWKNNPAGSISAEDPTFSPTEDPDDVGPYEATLANTTLTDDVITIDWTESIQAVGTLTLTGNITNGDQVELGGKTYTFQTVLTDVDGNVLVGGTAEASIDNLVAAINLAAGSGSTYAAATTAHPNSGAVKLTASTMRGYALAGGTAGNALTTTDPVDTGTAMSWGAGVLSGGTDNDAATATLTGASTVGGSEAARISAATIDRDTGELSITFVAKTIGTNNGPDADSITVDYDFGGTAQTVTDDGAGAFSTTTTGSTVITGTVDYDTGAISVTFTGGTDIPFDGNDVSASYESRLWELAAANEGAWSSRMTFRLTGNSDSFIYGTQATANAGTYGSFDVTVLLENTFTLEDEVKETYEELVFGDTTDALYFADVINDNSDFVTVTDLGALAPPSSFSGVDRTESMGTGDSTPTLTFTGTLTWAALVKTSLVITYTPVATGTRTLTADSAGNITGTGLDTTKTNSINYTTGAFTLNFLSGSDAPADTTDISGAYISMPATSSVDYTFSNGADGTLSGATFDRTVFSSPILSTDKLGMYALDRVDEVMQLIIPDFAGDTVVMGDMIDYAELRKDLFLIMTTPAGYSASRAVDFKRIDFPRRTKYAAYYWPWIRVTDPTNAAKTLTVPPVAHVAGIYARTDSTRNVGKAPGGVVDGALQFLVGLETNPDKGERDTVYPARINPLINTPQTGLAVWGVRTSSVTNDVLRYVNAVRLFQFVEKSIFNSTQGFVFESITSNLYSQIKTTVDSFLLNLFNTGHFAGSTPDQAFFVIVDSTNNPVEVINQGQVVVDIGIAPNRPGEFIRFRFAQKTLTA